MVHVQVLHRRAIPSWRFPTNERRGGALQARGELERHVGRRVRRRAAAGQPRSPCDSSMKRQGPSVCADRADDQHGGEGNGCDRPAVVRWTSSSPFRGGHQLAEGVASVTTGVNRRRTPVVISRRGSESPVGLVRRPRAGLWRETARGAIRRCADSRRSTGCFSRPWCRCGSPSSRCTSGRSSLTGLAEPPVYAWESREPDGYPTVGAFRPQLHARHRPRDRRSPAAGGSTSTSAARDTSGSTPRPSPRRTPPSRSR